MIAPMRPGEDLLLSRLDIRQREDYRRSGHFFVTARSGRRYRIGCGIGNDVSPIMAVDRLGYPTGNTYCILIKDKNLPACDACLAQAMLVATHEWKMRLMGSWHVVRLLLFVAFVAVPVVYVTSRWT